MNDDRRAASRKSRSKDTMGKNFREIIERSEESLRTVFVEAVSCWRDVLEGDRIVDFLGLDDGFFCRKLTNG